MFISFPEVILIMMIGFGLCGIILPVRKITVIAALQAIFAFIIMYINTPFGLHNLFQFISLLIIITVILRIKMIKATIPLLIGVFIDTACQNIFIVLNLFNTLDLEKMGHDFLYTLPRVLILFAILLTIFFIIKENKIILCRISINDDEKIKS